MIEAVTDTRTNTAYQNAHAARAEALRSFWRKFARKS